MLKTDKYINKIIVMLVLGCSIVSCSAGANELNKVDIKKSNSAGTALNVTIFTANPYDENIAVSQKSENKYVILIPNVSGANTSSVDFSTIKDIVSDVNIKSVNDGANGYTKVTLTTTKPVSISTASKKSTPLTEEQKAYKNLIAQSRGYKVSDKQPRQQSKPNIDTVTVSPPTNTAEKKPSPAVSKPTTENNVQPNSKSSISKTKDIVDNSNSSSGNIDNKNQKTVGLPAGNISQKSEKIQPKDTTLSDLKKDLIKENKLKQSNNTDTVSENEITYHVPQTKDLSYTHKQITSKGIDMFTILITLLVSIFGMGILARVIREQIENSSKLRSSFKDNLREQSNSGIIDLNDIAGNTNLSWQEKYKNYCSRIEEIKPEDGVLKSIGNGEYEFVNSSSSKENIIPKLYKKDSVSDVENPYSKKSNLKPAHKPKLTAYNKPAVNSMPTPKPIRKVKNQALKPAKEPKLEIVERKSEATTELDFRNLISKLDRTLNDSPSKERLNTSSEAVIEQQFKSNLTKENNNKPAIVHNEEEVISKSMRTSPKLKSFAQKVALEKTSRRVNLPKNRSEIIKSKNIESKHVNLENSELYSFSRKFKGANLSSADLLSGSVMGTKSNKNTQQEQTPEIDKSYSMASIDDFFNAPASSGYVTAPESLSSRVADSLGKMGRESAPAKKEMPYSGNPFGNKIVRSGYNIDSNSGFFMLADENGNSSLVGRVNNTVTVLKEFNAPVKYRVQVRKDNDNVYMVRVGAERFLVELNGEKMGVLIEL